MPQPRSTTLFVFIVCTLPVAVFAQSLLRTPSLSSQAEQQMIGYERAVWEAAKSHDMRRFDELVADEARMIFTSGIVTKRDYMSSIAERKITDFALSDFQVLRPLSDTVIIIYRARISGVFHGNPVSSVVVREASVWVRRSGKWQAVLNQETPLP